MKWTDMMVQLAGYALVAWLLYLVAQCAPIPVRP